MDTDTLITIAVAVIAFVGMIGGILARDRQLTRLITDGDDKLHDRVNRVRDEYVRRADLNGHIQRLDANIQNLAKDMHDTSQETTRRLDAILTAMSKKD